MMLVLRMLKGKDHVIDDSGDDQSSSSSSSNDDVSRAEVEDQHADRIEAVFQDDDDDKKFKNVQADDQSSSSSSSSSSSNDDVNHAEVENQHADRIEAVLQDDDDDKKFKNDVQAEPKEKKDAADVDDKSCLKLDSIKSSDDDDRVIGREGGTNLGSISFALFFRLLLSLVAKAGQIWVRVLSLVAMIVLLVAKTPPCRYCTKTFPTKQGLGGHQRAHSTERAATIANKRSKGVHPHSVIRPHIGPCPDQDLAPNRLGRNAGMVSRAPSPRLEANSGSNSGAYPDQDLAPNSLRRRYSTDLVSPGLEADSGNNNNKLAAGLLSNVGSSSGSARQAGTRSLSFINPQRHLHSVDRPHIGSWPGHATLAPNSIGRYAETVGNDGTVDLLSNIGNSSPSATTNLDKIPHDNVLMILQRLDSVSRLSLEIVLNLWKNTIGKDLQPCDLELIVLNQPPKFISMVTGMSRISVLHLFNGSFMVTSKIIRNPIIIPHKYFLHSTTLGYICFASKKQVNLWNPLTEDVLFVPGCPASAVISHFGLGFDDSSKAYKVVHVYSNGHDWMVEIQTLGSGEWRPCDIDEEDKFLENLESGLPVYSCVANSLNWLLKRDWLNQIFSFDLKSENFKTIEHPKAKKSQLIDLNDGVIGFADLSVEGLVTIWGLEADSNWQVRYRVVTNRMNNEQLEIMGVWNNGKEVLLKYCTEGFMSYNTDSNEIKTVEVSAKFRNNYRPFIAIKGCLDPKIVV